VRDILKIECDESGELMIKRETKYQNLYEKDFVD